MNRKDEVKENNENLHRLIKIATEDDFGFTKKDLTNLNLSAISDYLADISLTLAIIADKIGGEDEE